VAEKEPPDEEAERLRRAEELREAVEGLTGGRAGDRPRPRPGSPHEFVEERMREEAERREAEDEGGSGPDNEEEP
jgi:hypothetical protein